MIGMMFACFYKEETFIEDFKDAGLSKYTEEGNNVVSAYDNGQVWKSEYYVPPSDGAYDELRFYHQNDSIWMALSGENKSTYRPFLLMFFLDVRETIDSEYLLNLKNRELELNPSNTLILSTDLYTDNFIDTAGTALKGNLFIRNLSSETSFPKVIAGTFGFDAEIDGEAATFYKGRFDFELRKSSIIDLKDFPSQDRNEAGDPVLRR